MFRLVEGTNIVGEDVVCPTGALKNVPDYEYSDAFGEVPLPLENSVKAPFGGMHVYGRSEQFTTTGAQLLNPDELIPGYYDQDGNVLNIANGRISMPKISIPSGETKLSISNLAQGISLLYCLFNSEGKLINRQVGYNKQAVITLTSDTASIGLSFYNADNIQVTADMLQSCMVNFGNIKPWEPYTGGRPSPNPEYPQEIEHVGCVMSTGKNLMDKTGYRPLIDISISAGTVVFASVEDTADEFVVDIVNVDGTVNMIPLEKTKDNRRYDFRTLTAETKQIRFRGTIAAPMLTISNEYIPYELYTGGKPAIIPGAGQIPLVVRGKNLWDKSKLINGEFVTINGMEYFKYTDGSKSFEFDLSWNESTEQLAFTTRLLRDKADDANTETGIKLHYGDGSYDTYFLNIDNIMTKVSAKGKVLKKITGVNSYNRLTYIDLSVTQLEIGTTATPYEPYVEPQSLTLATPNGLPGAPVKTGGNYTDSKGQQYICDEIDLGRGKYVQRVKDFIINQNTRISTSMGTYGAPEKDTILARYSDRTIKKNGAILCRELIHIPNWNVDSESVHTTETSIDFRLSRKRLGLGTETTTEENKTAVLKFLETTPLHCLVELNTPIERDLAPEEIEAYGNLTANDGTTVIDIEDENIPTYVSATYPVIPAYGKMEGNTLRVSKVQSEGFKPIITDSTTYAEARDSVFIGYMDRPDSIARVYGANPLDERTE